MDVNSIPQLIRERSIEVAQSEEFLSFGSTLVNLGVTGHPKHGLQKGSYCLLVGGSNSGKTWLGLSLIAEAAHNELFDSYSLVYNGPEDGAKMDVEKCFGKKTKDRIQLLTPGDGASASPEEFYDHLDDTMKEGPTVYILDSMDALMPKDDEEQQQKERKARETGKETSGSYGTAKAKINPQRLRASNAEASKTGGILVIICQVRDNIGFGSQFKPEVRGGGRALEFYAQTQIWLKKKQSIDRPYKGIQEQVGAITQAKIKRTRFTGREADVEFPIYFSAGLDDFESCIHYLIKYKHWKGDKTKVVAPEFNHNGTIDKLAQEISNNPKFVIRLRKITAAAWKNVEEHIKEIS